MYVYVNDDVLMLDQMKMNVFSFCPTPRISTPITTAMATPSTLNSPILVILAMSPPLRLNRLASRNQMPT